VRPLALKQDNLDMAFHFAPSPHEIEQETKKFDEAQMVRLCLLVRPSLTSLVQLSIRAVLVCRFLVSLRARVRLSFAKL
jgi:hypothetical protein